jgi:hypothetical protein
MKNLIGVLTVGILIVACGAPPEEIPYAEPLPDAGVVSNGVQPVPEPTCVGVWVQKWVHTGSGARLIYVCEEQPVVDPT